MQEFRKRYTGPAEGLFGLPAWESELLRARSELRTCPVVRARAFSWSPSGWELSVCPRLTAMRTFYKRASSHGSFTMRAAPAARSTSTGR